ncbi:MAG: hypothetical protein ACI9TY_000641 [Alphaproteobacteria bacterium]|jgi:hypothetical protein
MVDWDKAKKRLQEGAISKGDLIALSIGMLLAMWWLNVDMENGNAFFIGLLFAGFYRVFAKGDL